MQEDSGTILRLPETKVRGVYAPIYPGTNWNRVGSFLLAGIVVDAALLSALAYAVSHQCSCPDYGY